MNDEQPATPAATISYGALYEIAQFFRIDYNDLIEVVDDYEKTLPATPQQPAAASAGASELVTALHTLASHFENSLYAFRDDVEARTKAEGDIAHAMKVAAKHNRNGAALQSAATK